MFRSPRSRSKCAWVRARAASTAGSPASHLAVSCSRSMVFRKTPPAWRLRWVRRSFRSRPRSSSVSRGSEAMKAADVRSKSADQLNDELIKLKKEQFNLRFQAATGQLEKTGRATEVRRDIARIKTILREKAQAGKA